MKKYPEYMNKCAKKENMSHENRHAFSFLSLRNFGTTEGFDAIFYTFRICSALGNTFNDCFPRQQFHIFLFFNHLVLITISISIILGTYDSRDFYFGTARTKEAVNIPRNLMQCFSCIGLSYFHSLNLFYRLTSVANQHK